MDATSYKAHDQSPVTEYTISNLSLRRPSSVSAERLDARFASSSGGAGDFSWLTLFRTGGDDVVLLVDGKGLEADMNEEAAKGMRMNVQLVWVGEGAERTALVSVLEGIVPRF